MDLFEFIYSSNKARTLQELSDYFLEFLQDLGFDYFKFTDISFFPAVEKDETTVLMTNYPQIWLKKYRAGKYFLYDPVYHEAYKTDFPFIWRQMIEHTKNVKAKEIMIEAGTYSLVDGITVPLHCLSGYVYIVNFVSSHRMDTPDKNVKSICNAAARQLFFVYTMICKNITYEKQLYLTPKEKEVLFYIAAGKTKNQTADILSVSRSCIKRHCENIFVKLEVKNLPAAVAKAVRYKLINL